jgi:TolB protein
MKHLLLFSVCALLLAPCSNAQVRVVKSANRKITLDISRLRAGRDSASQTFFQTLEKDLRLSGWFDPRRGSGELRLTGTIGPSGRKLKVLARVVRSSDQAQLFAKSYSIETAHARTLAHRVADEIIGAITGHKGIASTKIAFVGNRGGVKELYLCDADGGGGQQLTRDGSIVVGANWSPNGDSILFTSFKRGFPDVHQIDLRRKKRTVLAAYPGVNTGAALSPDGKTLALILSKDGNPELYIRSVRGGEPIRLTRTRSATEASPCWSPDGQSLVYVSDSSGSPQLYIINRAGGRPKRLSSRGSENVAPDWGPNGLIACASRSGGRYVIAIIHPATGQTTYLSTDGADYEDPSWAPDGRHIVASRAVNYQSSLYLLDTVSDPPVALLQGGGNWLSPAWSPR